jgi:hypothetical protein
MKKVKFIMAIKYSLDKTKVDKSEIGQVLDMEDEDLADRFIISGFCEEVKEEKSKEDIKEDIDAVVSKIEKGNSGSIKNEEKGSGQSKEEKKEVKQSKKGKNRIEKSKEDKDSSKGEIGSEDLESIL